MDSATFRYVPKCSAPGCDRDADYKVAATWSDGASWELKNYGLACEAHSTSQLTRGKLHRDGLSLAEGETLGPVGLYRLESGRRDKELKRLHGHEDRD